MVVDEHNATNEVPITIENDQAREEVVEQRLRRSERIKRKTSNLNHFYQTLFEAISTIPDPNTYFEVNKNPEREKWISAINQELESMNKNNVWAIVPRPPE